MSNIPPTNAHIEWCRSLYSSINDQGSWGIPACGLVFQKRAPAELVCVARMPHVPEMSMTAAKLFTLQELYFEQTRQHFAEIGVTVRDETIGAKQ